MAEKTLQVSLQFVWKARLKLHAEGNKLHVEGDKLYVEGDKLYAKGNKLRAEGRKLYAKGDKLHAEGDIMWADAILAICGNIKIEWKNDECHLETGEIFKP